MFNVHPSKNVSEDLETDTQLPVGEKTKSAVFNNGRQNNRYGYINDHIGTIFITCAQQCGQICPYVLVGLHRDIIRYLMDMSQPCTRKRSLSEILKTNSGVWRSKEVEGR